MVACVYICCMQWSALAVAGIGMSERARSAGSRNQGPQPSLSYAAASCGCNCTLPQLLLALLQYDLTHSLLRSYMQFDHKCMCALITGQPGMHAHSPMHTNVINEYLLTQVEIEILHMPSINMHTSILLACMQDRMCVQCCLLCCIAADHYERKKQRKKERNKTLHE